MNYIAQIKGLEEERAQLLADVAKLQTDNEHLCDMIEATRQDNADYINDTLEGKLQVERDRLKAFAE